MDTHLQLGLTRMRAESQATDGLTLSYGAQELLLEPELQDSGAVSHSTVSQAEHRAWQRLYFDE